MRITNNLSALVSGFARVEVANGLACPCCGKAFGAHDLHHDGEGEFHLRCAGCQHDAVTAVLAIDDEEDE